jgi:hypothetical protein
MELLSREDAANCQRTGAPLSPGEHHAGNHNFNRARRAGDWRNPVVDFSLSLRASDCAPTTGRQAAKLLSKDECAAQRGQRRQAAGVAERTNSVMSRPLPSTEKQIYVVLPANVGE